MSNNREYNKTKLRSRILTGGMVTIFFSINTRLISIISISVLARILSPNDFGIIAISLVFIGLSDVLLNRQFELALINIDNLNDSHYNTAFTLSFVWGIFAGVMIFISADSISTIVKNSELGSVLKLLALVPVLDSLRNPRFVDFERGLLLLPEMLIGFSAKCLQSGLAILLAFMWGDYWAIVAGMLAFSACRLMLTYILLPYKPTFTLANWQELLGFGSWLSGAGLFGFVMQKTDTALIGAKLGTATLGLYNLGTELALMATHYLAIPLTRAVYPGLAAVSGDPIRMHSAYYKAQEVMMGVLLPVGIGVALIPSEIIFIFLGPKWKAAEQVLQLLVPTMTLSVLVFNAQSLLMAQGDTRSMFVRNLIVSIVQVPLIVFGLWSWGIWGALFARSVSLLLHTYLTLRVVAKITGDGWQASIMIVWRSFVSCVVMAVGLVVIFYEFPAFTNVWSAIVSGAVKGLVGVFLYMGTHVALWFSVGKPDGFEQAVFSLLQTVIGRGKSMWIRRIRR